jgi:hypothetical protein
VYETGVFVSGKRGGDNPLGGCPRIETLLRKNPFWSFFPNIFVKERKCSKKLTQKGFPSLRLLFSDSLLDISRKVTFMIIGQQIEDITGKIWCWLSSTGCELKGVVIVVSEADKRLNLT